MAEWTDSEISRRLALAIGWGEDQMEESANGCGVLLPGSDGEMWRIFDYRDPAVIWPIAERFDAFPWFKTGAWEAVILERASTIYAADTAAKAVALAVIKSKDRHDRSKVHRAG